MRTSVAFQNCEESITAQVAEHWVRHEARLDELIGSEDPEATQLDLRVQREAEPACYAVRVLLPLPSGTLTAEAREEDLAAALDKTADQLAEAVQQHRGGGASRSSAMDEVEAASVDSFPASDPPSWTHVSASGASS